MVGKFRQLSGKRHILSDRGLRRFDADRIARRLRSLGFNARVVKDRNRWAIYRRCDGRRQPGVVPLLKKRIHINRHMIAHNKAHPNEPKPPITIQTSKGSIRANKVRMDGPSTIKYEPCDPLSCGATLWIETSDNVELDNCGEVV